MYGKFMCHKHCMQKHNAQYANTKYTPFLTHASENIFNLSSMIKPDTTRKMHLYLLP